MRYPSYLISCTHCSPAGGESASTASCGENAFGQAEWAAPSSFAIFFASLLHTASRRPAISSRDRDVFTLFSFARTSSLLPAYRSRFFISSQFFPPSPALPCMRTRLHSPLSFL